MYIGFKYACRVELSTVFLLLKKTCELSEDQGHHIAPHCQHLDRGGMRTTTASHATHTISFVSFLILFFLCYTINLNIIYYYHLIMFSFLCMGPPASIIHLPPDLFLIATSHIMIVEVTSTKSDLPFFSTQILNFTSPSFSIAHT